MVKYLLVFLLLFGCKDRPVDQFKNLFNNNPEINLTISEVHKKPFRLVVNSYQESEMDEVFSNLEIQTNKKCSDNKPSIEGQNWVVSALMSGCLNFYMMNDINAYKSFNLIKQLTPRETRDCYTVGFSQFYLMYAFSQCKNITAIDIDWRILHAHYQLLKLIKYDSDKTLNILNKIKLDPKTKNRHLRTFCSSVDLKSCEIALRDFIKYHKEIEKINLQLFFLHHAKFIKTDNTIVVYLSNAIDPEYTTQEQFNILVNNIANALNNQKAYIVYHTGGNENFAVYTLYKDNDKKIIRTICRDELVWSDSYGSMARKKYNTYFDVVSQNKMFIGPCTEY